MMDAYDWNTQYEQYIMASVPDDEQALVEIDYAAEPLSVSVENIDMPQDDSVAKYLSDLESFGTSILSGAAGGIMPGEFERMAKGLVGAIAPEVGQDRLDAFFQGIAEEPSMYSAEDFYNWLGTSESSASEDIVKAGQVMGEFLAPGGILAKAGQKLANLAKPAVAATAAMPAAAQGATDQYSDKFINYLMENENAEFASGRSKVARHKSPEGGLDTVGFGHKLTTRENRDGKIYGIPIKDIDVEKAKEILIKDIEKARSTAKSQLKQMHPDVDFDSLSQDKQEMLTDFAFNLKGGLKTFPSFVRGVVTDDAALMKKEYKRFYTDAKGKKSEVKKRNTDFFDMYLRNLSSGE